MGLNWQAERIHGKKQASKCIYVNIYALGFSEAVEQLDLDFSSIDPLLVFTM